MRRRLFTLLSAVSLLLCGTTCVLWLRSYWVVDEMGRYTANGQTLVSVYGGLLAVDMDGAKYSAEQVGTKRLEMPTKGDEYRRGWGGFKLETGANAELGYRWLDFGTPLWVIAMLFANSFSGRDINFRNREGFFCASNVCFPMTLIRK